MNEKYVTSFRIIMAGIYTYLLAAIATILWDEFGWDRYDLLVLFGKTYHLGWVGVALIVIGVIYCVKSWYDLRKNKI